MSTTIENTDEFLDRSSVLARAPISSGGRAGGTCEPSHGLRFRVELGPGLGCRRALVGQVLDARRRMTRAAPC